MISLRVIQSPVLQMTVATVFLIFTALSLGLVGANWTWIWFAPQSAEHQAHRSSNSENLNHAFRLFDGTETTGMAAGADTTIKLLGIVSSTGMLPAYALLQIDGGKSQLARVGENLGSGITLARVLRNSIAFDQHGVTTKIELPERNALPGAVAPTVKR